MVEKVFPAKTEALDDVIAFLESVLDDAGCSMKIITQLSVALEEVFVNVAHYAYPSSEGEVAIALAAESGQVFIRLADSGVPFNPLEKEDPDITLAAEDRAIGGLGIYMVKKTMDDVLYENIEGKNILTLIKKYS